MAALPPLTPVELTNVLSQSLSPDLTIRSAAERSLLAAQSQPGHALAVLRLISADPSSSGGDVVQGAMARQAAAVHFKNMVKKGWVIDDDDDATATAAAKQSLIPMQDRTVIKNNLVQLMCTVPPQIQSQIGEAISLIASHDFPSQWDNLLTDLISKFGDSDMNVVNGVLITANSIFKRFRYVQRSDDLYADILYVLNKIQEPLTRLFLQTAGSLDGNPSIPEVTARLAALRSMCRIFYSLNYQDLPEYFEDHMPEWMGGFAKLLEYANPALVDEDEEMQPGESLARLIAIVKCLVLSLLKEYAHSYIYLSMLPLHQQLQSPKQNDRTHRQRPSSSSPKPKPLRKQRRRTIPPLPPTIHHTRMESTHECHTVQ